MLRQARQDRDKADHARRLAAAIGIAGEVHDRLLAYAQELDNAAAALEREAETLGQDSGRS